MFNQPHDPTVGRHRPARGRLAARKLLAREGVTVTRNRAQHAAVIEGGAR